jgi:hypothetical protein
MLTPDPDKDYAGLVERLKHVNARRCPFDDPAFRMDPLKPCPVCGDVGGGPGVDEPSKCVSNNYAVLHTEAATAISDLTARLAEAEWLAYDIGHDGRRVLWSDRWSDILGEYKHELARANAAEAALATVTAERDAMREALSELADLVDASLIGEYDIDSFTAQPARRALSEVKQ